MRQSEPVIVIGAGLAGTECAYQLARRGIAVHLYEMRPQKETPAHRGPFFSELVCSNSFGSDAPFSASRILKDELALLGSLTLEVAREFSVPAGASLAVDREKFSRAMTAVVESLPGVTVFRQEVPEIPKEGIVVLATGPLTSPSLCDSLKTYLGGQSLYFYDAISPIVSKESLDLDQMYFANRYGKGETPDFLNIPLEKSHYEELIQDLLTSEVVLPHDFEEEKYFEGCMPIEALAARGPKTLAFGPMKPVGLENPRTGKRPYAVIQLRTENRHGTAYNLVGFQTKLRYKEQERVFRKLPGMANAEFLRLGCMHRNTYIHSPSELNPTLQMRRRETLFIAGQLTGTEGYLESSAGGLIAGRNAADLVLGKVPRVLPEGSMLGALLLSITDASKASFQPSNVNFGLMPPLDEPIRDKKLRNERYGLRSIAAIEEFLKEEESLKAFSLGDYKPASASLP